MNRSFRGTTMDRRIHNTEWIHVLRPLAALEHGVAECLRPPRIAALGYGPIKVLIVGDGRFILGRNRADLIFGWG
ncbi:hypothetical protein CEXT_776931 [Caerostris extrusa]|uniref:Uncharacterized protein n=1 Tax=Caerostris extrusa TaxID=172846 RepID=A0AAV4SK22_CAEEX|nr:hypothetical protein CEXT_776931 [Caerostris extrusa]